MGTTISRHIWEGWTVAHFIDELTMQIELIMNGESWHKPFTSKRELSLWCQNNQPHYKKSIPEVNNHFAKKYNLH